MKKIFYPESLVVVGVSDSANNLGRSIAENIINYKYKGKLYLAGRQAGILHDIPIAASIDELPDGIDLAVILTPANSVPAYLDACGKKGIKYAIIESGGFSEFNEQGKKLEYELLSIAHKHGMRFVGPNCIGVSNTFSGINTLFVKMFPDELVPGRVSLLAQSGGVVLTCTDMLAARGLGIGKTVSVGNKVDLKEPDYINYFEQDEDTDIIILYLESIDNGRGLLDAARLAKKPIIIYKSNTSQASAHIAQSHTAALANDDRIVDAAFKQYGIARARSLQEMGILGKAFSMPPVRGNRLAVISRSGGHAIISADMSDKFGFVLPDYPEKVLATAKKYFRADVVDAANPLDLGVVFDFSSYAIIIEECLQSMQPDAVMLIFNYRRETIPTARQIAEELKNMSRRYDVPIALVFFIEMDEVAYLERNLGYPVFSEVYDAMFAFSASREHYQRKQKIQLIEKTQPNTPAIPSNAVEKARKIIAASAGKTLLLHEAMEICAAFGMPVAPWELVNDVTEAVKSAARIGYPLVLKLVASEAVHKSDIGGVVVNIQDEEQLRRDILSMQQRASQHGIITAHYFLQKMISSGREVILGGKLERSFGPIILFGMGGVFVEVFNDVSLRVAPLARLDAQEMLAELRGGKLLDGLRGQSPSDKEAIIDVMLKLSQMMIDLPEISEIDINPLIALEKGAALVDARIITA